MKRFSVLLAFVFTAMAAVAQTDTNAIAAPVETNAPADQPDTNAAAVLTATNPAPAPAITNPVAAQTNLLAFGALTRTMSLEDCIQEALQHNLDLQIERTAPQI